MTALLMVLWFFTVFVTSALVFLHWIWFAFVSWWLWGDFSYDWSRDD